MTDPHGDKYNKNIDTIDKMGNFSSRDDVAADGYSTGPTVGTDGARQPETGAEDVETDTIAALATASSTSAENSGAIGIIRLSGPGAFRIASRIYHGNKPFDAIKPYTIGYGSIYERSVSPGTSGRVIDEVLILKMRAPRSYTREDIVEIHCHAGADVQNRILRLVMANGARAAEPGEFTKRAFLNGRIDLSQAEAVMDLIRAKSEAGAALAMRQLEGALSLKLDVSREALIDLIATLEANLDFPEHDIEELSISETDIALNNIERELNALLESFEYGKVAREGITAVIAGRPNVGKSTLLNLFAGKERAIVTEIPGTTRDIVDEYKNIGGFTVRFLDTAGIRDTEDVVERLGVARTIGELEKADLALLMFSADEDFGSDDARLLYLTIGRKRVFIINKTDLSGPHAICKIKKTINDHCECDGCHAKDSATVEASLINGEGLMEIEEAIGKLFTGQMPPDYSDAVLTNARHRALTSRSLESLRAARTALNARLPLEMPIIDMRDALAALGEITGKTYSEDIIDRIFSEFCVGK